MLDFNLFEQIYDFSLIEDAVQAFFVALPTGSFVKPPDETDPARETWTPGANIPIFTPQQALVFQAARPRIGIMETQFRESGEHVLDADGQYRASGWRGLMKFALVTAPNYTLHRQLRSVVMAIIPQLQPSPINGLAGVSNTGINAYLKYHEVGQFALQSGDTTIKPETGYYLSVLQVNLTFSVRSTVWPSGTQTT